MGIKNNVIFIGIILVIIILSIIVISLPIKKSPSKIIDSSTITLCQELNPKVKRCNLIMYSGAVNYHNGSGYVLINTSLVNSSYGDYTYEMVKANYHSYFKKSQPVFRFEKDGYYLTFSLEDGEMSWKETSNNKNHNKLVGNAQSNNGSINRNKIHYSNIFNYTNVSYELYDEMVKELLILSAYPPLSNDSLYLEYTGEVVFSNDLDVYVAGKSKNNKEFQSNGTIEFRDSSNSTIFFIPPPTVIDANYTAGSIYYNLKITGNKIKFGLRINKSFLASAAYPVGIDPTIKINGSSTGVLEDASIYYNGAGAGNNESITFMKFNISAIPAGMQIDEAKLYLRSYSAAGREWAWSSTDKINISRVVNQTWREENGVSALNGMAYANTTQNFNKWTDGTNFSLGTWDFLNVTSIINIDYQAGNPNCSFRIQTQYALNNTPDTNYGSGAGTLLYFGDSSLVNGLIFTSKEYSTVAYRPYMNITYTDITAPTATIKVNTTSPKIAWHLNISSNVTDVLGLSNCIFWNNMTSKNSSGVPVTGTSGKCSNVTTITVTQGKNVMFKVYVNDTTGNWKENSSVVTIADTAPGTPSLIYPTNGFTISTASTWLNYSATDADNDTLTYYVYADNETNPTTLVFNGSSTYYNYSGLADGETYYWKVHASDSLVNGTNSSTYSFIVSTTAPAVNLEHPINDSWITSQPFFINFTATDSDGLSEVHLYGNWSGAWAKNQSLTGVVSGTSTNFSALTLSDEAYYIYNVWANDTTGAGAYYLFNYTFGVDTIFPNVAISYPYNGDTFSSGAIPLNNTASDTLLNSCWYQVRYADTGSEYVTNTSMTCNSNTTFTAVAYAGRYTAYMYANDTAGNTNSTSINITVQAASTGTVTGGGGGGGAQTAETVFINVTGPFCGDGICQKDFLYNNTIYDESKVLTDNYCRIDCPLEKSNLPYIALIVMFISIAVIRYFPKNQQIKLSKAIEKRVDKLERMFNK